MFLWISAWIPSLNYPDRCLFWASHFIRDMNTRRCPHIFLWSRLIFLPAAIQITPSTIHITVNDGLMNICHISQFYPFA